LPISGTVTIGSALPAGTNQIGVVTIGSGTVTLGASTAQIGSVTASISGAVTVGAIIGPTSGNCLQAISPSGDAVRSVLLLKDSGGTYGIPNGSATNVFNLPVYGTVTVGNSITIGSLPAISGTVTANLGNVAQSMPLGTTTTIPSSAVRIGWADEEQFYGVGVDSYGNPLPIQILLGNAATDRVTTANPLPISGTVTANLASLGGFPNAVQLVNYNEDDEQWYQIAVPNAGSPYIPTQIVGGTVTIGSALPAGTNQIGVVTANTFAVQGTAVTTSNFTSTTPSTVLAGFNATREVLTIFNEGAGNLHICAGATCTTIAYQVRLSAGDYYEVPNHQTTITHSAVFATAGTARVCQVS
jgi:hypothetical protein